MPRGGDQVIPRPPSARAGAPAPWADRPPTSLGLDHVRHRLAQAGPAARWELAGPDARAAAVLAPLYEHAGEAHVVLTRRADHLRSHRSEVSFPGGTSEPDDPDLVATALREAHEETALDPRSVEIIGELDHRGTVTSRSFIVPYVGTTASRPELVANPDEVARILHVPLAELFDPRAYREELWQLPIGERPIWFFELEGETVWGATAAMLRNLCCLIAGVAEPH
ncbi:MAG: CoA pyrophosphatase [Acidimicrobiia bacterium]|nr:CoA pyrophosphatase [Acidimicrobiia bacterium]